jgi:hypothetical protein
MFANFPRLAACGRIEKKNQMEKSNIPIPLLRLTTQENPLSNL